ncbi:MAG: heavy-metal-associated domain-containing protein [Lachnospiraceae bacterium]|nr:heavy-metal-associated domain-containing protein [Lachnospiraceae bacterium]
MGNIIVIAVLAVILIFAVKEAVKHLKGQGDCCGGGSEPVEISEDKKELTAPVIERKILHIEGMHCENCKARVERAINRIDGAAAEVDLKKKLAVVSCDRQLSDDLIVNAVSVLDYKVVSVEHA